MSKHLKSIMLHTVEAVIVAVLAIVVAYFFPEHSTTAGVIAFGALSAIAKAVRVTDIPVPDYVNGNIAKDQSLQ